MESIEVKGALVENFERDFEKCLSASNSSWTEFLHPYSCGPLLNLWHGLPTHVLWPKLQLLSFYVFNTLSIIILWAALWVHVYHGFVRKLLLSLSKKIFGLSKPMIAFIFTQVCALVVEALFVPVIIAISASVVELGYPSRNPLDSKLPILAIFGSGIVVIVSVVVTILWIITKEKFIIDAEKAQQILNTLHFYMREHPLMTVLVPALVFLQAIVWARFGGEAFEFCLDKLLCVLLTLAAILTEVLSGLYLRPGVPWYREYNINIPSLNKPVWFWWIVHMFAFETLHYPPQLGYINDRCGPRGVGIGVASVVAFYRYTISTFVFAIIANFLPGFISGLLRWDETNRKTLSSHSVLFFFMLVENVMCVCACGWGELLGDKVAQDAAHWSSTAKFLTNWIARLLVLYFFVTTLAGFRDLIAGILNSKLPIAKILKDLVKTMQIKTVPDADDEEKEKSTFEYKYNLPDDFRESARVRRNFDRLVDSFFECKEKLNAVTALTFLKELKNINKTGFYNRIQSMEFYVQAKFKFQVKDSVSEDIMKKFKIEPIALMVHRHMPWVPVINIVENLALLFKVELCQAIPNLPSSKGGPIRFQRAETQPERHRDSANEWRENFLKPQIDQLNLLKKAIEVLGNAKTNIDSLYKAVDLVVDLFLGLESDVFELLEVTVLPALIQGVTIYKALKDVYEAEAHLELAMSTGTKHTFWRNAVVELAFSLLMRLINHTDQRISKGLTRMQKAKAKFLKRRPAQLEKVQLVRGMLHMVAVFCKLFMSRSFSSQLKHAEEMSAEGADQGAFETGLVRLRCEVRLDVLFAIGKQLVANLSKVTWFQQMLSLGFLLRLAGTYDLPLDAIGALIPQGGERAEADGVSLGGTSWMHTTHIHAQNAALEVYKQLFADGEGTIFSLIAEFSDIGNNKEEDAIKHITKLIKQMSESSKHPDAKRKASATSKPIGTLRDWLASPVWPLSNLEKELRKAKWDDDNFRSKTIKDIPSSISRGFRTRLINLISGKQTAFVLP